LIETIAGNLRPDHVSRWIGSQLGHKFQPGVAIAAWDEITSGDVALFRSNEWQALERLRLQGITATDSHEAGERGQGPTRANLKGLRHTVATVLRENGEGIRDDC
jgi:hypothetical protein